MKNATLTISFESEKLDVLIYHMGKKDARLQTELEDTVSKLYEKYVPQATREYIDDRLRREASEKRSTRHPVRPAAPSGSADRTT